MEDTLEIIDLESLLADSIHCQAQHVGEPVCSVEVVYIGTDCKTSIFLCKNSVDGKYGIRETMPHVNCRDCNRPASVCWKIRPI